MFKRLSLLLFFTLITVNCYAAFTVSTDANGLINVTAGSGDLDDIVSAVGNANYIDKVGDNYILNKNDTYANPRLYIGNGVTLDHNGDGWGLIWTDPTSNQNALYIYPGADVTLSGSNWTIQLSTTTDTPYTRFNGNVNLIGTESGWGKITDYHRLYIDPDRSIDQFLHFNYINFRDGQAAGSYALYFNTSSSQYAGKFTIENCDFTTSIAQSYMWYMGYSFFGDEQKIQDCTVSGSNLTYAVSGYNMTAKFKNCIFKDIINPAVLMHGGGSTAGKDMFDKIDGGGYYPERAAYRMVYFEGCTFDSNDSNVYQLQPYYGATVGFKDCEFIASGGQSVYIAYDGELLDFGGNTFTGGVADFNAVTGSSIYDCYPVDIHVQDINGNALAGSALTIGAISGTECVYKIAMFADENGDFRMFSGDVPYFPYYETGSASSTRDLSSYCMKISQKGYKTETVPFTLDGAKEFTITLEDDNVPEGISITGSTITGSTIG